MLGEEGGAGRGWLACLDDVFCHPFRAASFSARSSYNPRAVRGKVFLRHQTRSLTTNTHAHTLYFCATKYHLSAATLRR
jgi:hypothetical protein